MKKIILMLMLISSLTGFSQIKKIENQPKTEIGKISPMGNLVISLDKTGDDYIFTYRDAKFMQLNEYKTFSFSETGNDLENLYSEIVRGINDQPKEAVIIELPQGFIFLKFDKVMGSKNVQIGHSIDKDLSVIGFSRALTLRDVNKLFGKN